MFLREAGEVIENAVRKSDQRSKPITTAKHKHGRKVAKFPPPQKFPLTLVFMLTNIQDEQPSLGLLSSQNGTQRLRLGLSSGGGGGVGGGGVNSALICPAGVQRD